MVSGDESPNDYGSYPIWTGNYSKWAFVNGVEQVYTHLHKTHFFISLKNLINNQ